MFKGWCLKHSEECVATSKHPSRPVDGTACVKRLKTENTDMGKMTSVNVINFGIDKFLVYRPALAHRYNVAATTS